MPFSYKTCPDCCSSFQMRDIMVISRKTAQLTHCYRRITWAWTAAAGPGWWRWSWSWWASPRAAKWPAPRRRRRRPPPTPHAAASPAAPCPDRACCPPLPRSRHYYCLLHRDRSLGVRLRKCPVGRHRPSLSCSPFGGRRLASVAPATACLLIAALLFRAAFVSIREKDVANANAHATEETGCEGAHASRQLRIAGERRNVRGHGRERRVAPSLAFWTPSARCEICQVSSYFWAVLFNIIAPNILVLILRQLNKLLKIVVQTATSVGCFCKL